MFGFYRTILACKFNVCESKILLNFNFDLPYRLLCVFVLPDSNAHNFTAFFEVLIQLQLICTKIYIFNENATRIWIVFKCLIYVLAFMMRVWL